MIFGSTHASDLDKVTATRLTENIWGNQPSSCSSELLVMSPLSPSNVDSALECASKATSAPTKLVKITYDRAQDIPPELKEIIPGDVFERSQDGRWDLIISMPNDNAGFGLWQLITGTDSGNDFGNTHGTKIQIGTDTNGYYQQGAFETNLYTQQASSFNKNKQGRTKAYQFFTEENILSRSPALFRHCSIRYLSRN